MTYISVVWWYFSDHGSIMLQTSIEFIIFFPEILSLRENDIHIYLWNRGGTKQEDQEKLWCIVIKKESGFKTIRGSHFILETSHRKQIAGPQLQDSSIMSKYILIISSWGWLVHFAALLFSSFGRKWKQYQCKTLVHSSAENCSSKALLC